MFSAAQDIVSRIYMLRLTEHLFSPLYDIFTRAIAVMGGCSFMKRALDALRTIVL